MHFFILCIKWWFATKWWLLFHRFQKNRFVNLHGHKTSPLKSSKSHSVRWEQSRVRSAPLDNATSIQGCSDDDAKRAPPWNQSWRTRSRSNDGKHANGDGERLSTHPGKLWTFFGRSWITKNAGGGQFTSTSHPRQEFHWGSSDWIPWLKCTANHTLHSSLAR